MRVVILAIGLNFTIVSLSIYKLAGVSHNLMYVLPLVFGIAGLAIGIHNYKKEVKGSA